MSAVFHAAMTGETVMVEPGGWNTRRGPAPDQQPGSDMGAWVECEVHRNSEWDEHVRLTTVPEPEGSTLWNGVFDATQLWSRVAFPLHGAGLTHAVALILDATSRWGYGPDELVVTFQNT